MDDSQSFSQRLEESLEAKRERMDRVELPRLQDTFKNFQSAFDGLRSVMIKKGVLHEDPYRYDLKISEVTTPPEGPFAESEKSDQMSIRTSQFTAYLDFLNNYYQYSTEFLTMGRIKRILGLAKYFNFGQFSETSTQINTRALAEIASTIKKGTDQLSSGIVADCVGQLEKATREVLAVLKDLTSYHKERYKLELRQIVMPGLALDATAVIARREDAIRQVKRKFAEVAGEKPFYPELVEELLMEDYSSDGEALKDELLKRLQVQTEKKIEKNLEKSYKYMIMEGVRALSGCGHALEESLSKLGENSALLEARNQSLGAKILRLIRKIFSPGEKGIVYEIEIVDPVTTQRTPESVDFARFVEDSSRRASLLSSLMQKSGSSIKRIENMNEEQAYKFLGKTIEELQRTLRLLLGLEEYLRAAVGPEERAKLRGIKVELTAIKGAIIKANQKKHEYVAQREEVEQMHRLGIRDVAP